MNSYEIAIIGAGPGGLSAAAHAAEQGVSHVLLEATDKIANTIQKFQKGKHVMAEPSVLPLRSPLDFAVGRREEVLMHWDNGVTQHEVNIEYGAEVTAIDGVEGEFILTLKSGSQVGACHIVLAIGLQGNPRRLGIHGEDSAPVQYQLDDPDAYHDENIIVVGAGDAAIENAVAVAKNNRVTIVNRRDEFARAKEGNLNLILSAISDGLVDCQYSCTPEDITTEDDHFEMVLNAPEGELRVPFDRVIARLGAVAPRGLVESFGIEFPNDDPNAVPALSGQYESNIKGIYIIGALAGYPLIKQAMNQGYEVVEYIRGNEVQPADHNLLASKFADLPFELSVDDTLKLIHDRIEIFSEVNMLQLRELILDSVVRVPESGEVLIRKDDYTDTFFAILEGHVAIDIGTDDPITIPTGEFFGEMSLMSGRRRSATVVAGDNCVVVETPRRTMNKLIASVDAVREVLDQTFILRALQQKFAPNTEAKLLLPIAREIRINQYNAGDVIFSEGDHGDTLHYIRSGSVTVSMNVEGSDVVMNYVPAHQVVGEMALLGDATRTATVRANVRTQTLSIDKAALDRLLVSEPSLKPQLQQIVETRVRQNTQVARNAETGELLSFLMNEGVGAGTDVLLIDENICVGCDFCESACAATHEGTSRLDREAGPTFANIHVPTSCRHCEDPGCMKDCPADAIHRGGIGGEVYITDHCIGCGNCEQNCPYDVIQMSYATEAPKNFWSWLLFGLGDRPGKASVNDADHDAVKRAVKCDMCKDQSGGPACVRACPTGAAMRLNPEEFVNLISRVD
ncbi:MAG: cyclic nucleotide-binding domain-containing protein [Pseudomonadota bacterium]